MGAITWTFDAPTGTFKNHFISARIRESAIPETEFFRFVTTEPGYGRMKGESITITRIGNLPIPSTNEGGQLDEGKRIPEDEFAINVTQITVKEWGRAVPYQSLARDLMHFDLENQVQMRLKDQMARILDRAAAVQFKGNQIKAIPTGVSTIVFDTDGTASSQATVNMNLFHLERIRDFARETLNMPPWDGRNYRLLMATKGVRGLKDDPNLQKWFFHTTPRPKEISAFPNEVENTVIVEIANVDSLSNSAGLGGVLGEGVFFGDDPIVAAMVIDPEIRIGIPGDFGRSQAAAWYGVLQYGEPRPTANAGEARIIHVTSS